MDVRQLCGLISGMPVLSTVRGDIRVVAFEGRSGSGKTSLADSVGRVLGAPVFHLEDLYSGWDGLFGALSLYVEKVLVPLSCGVDPVWRVWDWDAQCWGFERSFSWSPIVIVEGVGSGCREAVDYLSGFFYLEADGDLRKLRALERSEYFVPFWDVWAGQEDRLIEDNDGFCGAFLKLDTNFLLSGRVEDVVGGWQICSMKLDTSVGAVDLFQSLYRDSDNLVWLDSSSYGDGRGSFSLLADDGGVYSKVVSYGDGRVSCRDSLGENSFVVPFLDWFDGVDSFLVAVEDISVPVGVPVGVGWLGYLGYELKGETGGEGRYRSGYAESQLIFADRAIVFDHDKCCVYIVSLVKKPVLGLDNVLCSNVCWVLDTYGFVKDFGGFVDDSGGLDGFDMSGVDFVQDESRDVYIDKIFAAQEEIRAGNSYEICLTTQFRASLLDKVDSRVAYLVLREKNPAPFGAYLKLGDVQVLSSSVERFFSLDRFGGIRVEPIKGTARRGDSVVEDRMLAFELVNSGKEVAENVMIVDLLRNDLLRIVDVGSLEVEKFCVLESYASVHQLVSSITGRVREGISRSQIIGSLFPGGSMTGVPKVSTMGIIDMLECKPRGVYSGAVGYVSVDGSADMCMPIRTLVVSDVLGVQVWNLGVGGAITLSSDAQSEYEEILVKARGVFNALGVSFSD